MINHSVWISPSGQELCVVDSKGWIFKKSKPGKVQGRHLSLALRALLYCQDVLNNV
uniref:Uncharacterized protein n=1 Tax=Castor canadensis TaxID=51338 RepID=A0A8C0W9B9_CASCN